MKLSRLLSPPNCSLHSLCLIFVEIVPLSPINDVVCTWQPVWFDAFNVQPSRLKFLIKLELETDLSSARDFCLVYNEKVEEFSVQITLISEWKWWTGKSYNKNLLLSAFAENKSIYEINILKKSSNIFELSARNLF